MTIRSIEAIPLSLPYEMFGPKPLFAGHPRQMEILLVRVETEEGQVGWGEAFGYAVWPATRAALEHLVAPLAIGRDETGIAELNLQLQRPLHLLGRTGAVTFALSGLDIALWDLAGKAAGKPVSALLGGARHRDLPVYASLMRYTDPALAAHNAAAAHERGFAAIKLHETGVEHVKMAREALGPQVGLMLDVNCPWNVDEAVGIAQQLARFDLTWFEEPVWPPEDFAALAQVRQRCGLAISAGENVMSATHFKQMFEAGAVDIAQPSVTKIGGISEFMKIAGIAARYCVPLVPHCPYFGPGLLASLHIASTFEAETMIEYSFADLGASPLGDAIAIRDGRITIPQAPGLGRDPDPDVIARYRVA
ncbi:mandelate racemase/muconate lactonizing protein [Caballeronia sordidicola]|uniref:Mandelate racemase/muconate lactonizing protein n=1 Tax=Caballeronia sordidicola TaxID=196367 RepID=A0A158GDG2_CABSO|nr:mandelate racemase/muconate lactonizing enzyme family protein [Caballeronia sordidicola]SAL30164.1 mandelate racemase/muconate lactonizing protein [Caballeronia sordidicola]